MYWIIDQIIKFQNLGGAVLLLIIGVWWLTVWLIATFRIKKFRKEKFERLKIKRNKHSNSTIKLIKTKKALNHRIAFWAQLGLVLSICIIPILVHLIAPIPFDYNWKPIHFLRGGEKSENKKLLLFIHGWIGSEQSWEDFTKLALKDDRLFNYDIAVINYPTMIVSRGLSIPQIADSIFHNLKDKTKHQKINIIAHSLGGLVARRLLIQNKLNNFQLNFQNSVSIGAPFAGADLALFGSVFQISPSILPDIKRNSTFLLNLELDWQSYRQDKKHTKQTCYSSPQDKIVDHASAVHLCDQFRSYPRWRHIEIARPPDAKNERYSWPIRAIISKN